MADSASFREIIDKASNAAVSLCRWNPNSDLLAFLMEDGEIRLHRLYGQKVWSYTRKGFTCTSISWSPDGSVCVAGYNDGILRVLDKEKATCLFETDIGSEITCLEWIMSCQGDRIYADRSSNIFDITSLQTKSTRKGRMSKIVDEPLSVLLVATKDCSVKLLLNGVYKIASLHLGDTPDLRIITMSITTDLSMVTVVTASTSGDDTTAKLTLLGSQLAGSAIQELSFLTLKYRQTILAMELCMETLKQMSAVWEDGFSKVGTKLEKFEKMLPADRTVADEFIDAYASLKTSAELETFLVRDLTPKGLSSLGSTVHNSSKNTKDLAINKLIRQCELLFYYLTELRGMARWGSKFGILGLQEDRISECIKQTGTVILKVWELVSVIKTNGRSFAAFFGFLSGVILRVSNKPIPDNLRLLDSQHHDDLLHFLKHKLKKQSNEGTFNLEDVSKYFSEKTFESPKLHADNLWLDFTARAQQSSGDHVFAPDGTQSLRGLLIRLQKAVGSLFESSKIEDSFTTIKEFVISEKQTDDHEDFCEFKANFWPGQDTKSVFMSWLPCCCCSNEFYLFKLGSTGIRLSQSVTHEFSSHALVINFVASDREASDESGPTIRDVTSYNSDVITLLLQESGDEETASKTRLCQLPLDKCFTVAKIDPALLMEFANAEDSFYHEVGSFISDHRCLDSFSGASVVSSGNRKVACVLASTRRRYRVFDMAASDDDNEDEEDDSVNLGCDESQVSV